MEDITLDLSPQQLKKLSKKMAVQVKHSMMGKGIKLKVSPTTAKKIKKAQRLNKGCRLCLTEEEMNASGIKEILASAKKFYTEKVRPVIGPSIRKGLKTGLKTGAKSGLAALGELSGQPEVVASIRALNPLIDRYIDKGVDYVGDTSGAFGLGKRVKMMPVMMPVAPMYAYRQPYYNYGDMETGNILI